MLCISLNKNILNLNLNLNELGAPWALFRLQFYHLSYFSVWTVGDRYAFYIVKIHNVLLESLQ